MGRQRIAALVALLVFVAIFLAEALLVLGNLGGLLLGLIGWALVVAGGWWALTEQMPRRGFGLAGVVIGVVVAALALVAVVTATAYPLVWIVAMAVLFTVGLVAARVALSGQIDIDTEPARPRRAVLLCNPWSGGGKVDRYGLADLARAKDVEVVMLDQGLDLEQLSRDAVARGADCLGMAGGDGSQALVASIAIEHDLPFVCVSAGTRNHFALDLGLDRHDPRRSLDAFDEGVERRVDYATVGDRLFVNNISLGVYAAVVQRDETRSHKVGTMTALLPELIGSHAEPFDLQFTDPDGREVDGAFLVQVSNNPYVLGGSIDTAQRRRLDKGKLGVFAVSSRTGPEAVELMTMSAVGRRARSPHWHEFTTDEFEVRSRSGTVAVAIDGEALTLTTPLRFRIHPAGLKLLVPVHSIKVAERRRARDVDLRELLTLVRGASARRAVGDLIYMAIMSVDGYIEDESGSFAWAEPSEEVHRFVNDLERGVRTYLYGRRMYEMMVFWENDPSLAEAPPVYRDFAEVWRAADKIVYSTTLEDVSTKRTRLERRFDPEAVRQMKATLDHDLSVGGPDLAESAFAAGLVDEVQIFTVPISVGGGKPAVPRRTRVHLELTEVRRFDSGFVFSRYRVRS